jgi:acetyl-CoA synthetase
MTQSNPTSDAAPRAQFPPRADTVANAHIDAAGYDARYVSSINDPDAFWGEQGKALDWVRPYTKVKNTSFDPHDASIKWFEDGTLNICANCVDRRLPTRAHQTAFIWERDEPGVNQPITYQKLYHSIN